MIFWEALRVAFDMLRLHKLRAFLTMLGVIIGVMAVTLISMVSNGFTHYITYEFKQLGSDTIIIMYDGGFGDRHQMRADIQSMEMSDVGYLMSRCQTLDKASATLMLGNQLVSYKDNEVRDAEVHGVDENMSDLNKVGIAQGRHIDSNDLAFRANVCEIGQEIKEKLFRGKDPIGEFVNFKGITLQVVGVMEKVEIMGQSNGKDVYVPITTAQDKWVGGDSITFVTTRPKPGISVESAMEDAWRALMVKSGNKRIYRIDSRESIMNVFGNILGVAGSVLAGIAALSLLVGGIGIMNIMLVSVTERTREIGLRKSVGAKRASIMWQFLIEAAILSVIGGFIGMGIAFAFGQGVTALTAMTKFPSAGGLQMIFPLQSALIATGFSAIIGIVFGFYPAARASMLSPIEALRTE